MFLSFGEQMVMTLTKLLRTYKFKNIQLDLRHSHYMSACYRIFKWLSNNIPMHYVSNFYLYQCLNFYLFFSIL